MKIRYDFVSNSSSSSYVISTPATYDTYSFAHDLAKNIVDPAVQYDSVKDEEVKIAYLLNNYTALFYGYYSVEIPYDYTDKNGKRYTGIYDKTFVSPVVSNSVYWEYSIDSKGTYDHETQKYITFSSESEYYQYQNKVILDAIVRSFKSKNFLSGGYCRLLRTPRCCKITKDTLKHSKAIAAVSKNFHLGEEFE